MSDDIHVPPPASTAFPSIPGAPAKLLWTIAEAASVIGVSMRTVWRLMADPKSGFPKPRRIRGRTLLVGAEVIAFVEGVAAR